MSCSELIRSLGLVIVWRYMNCYMLYVLLCMLGYVINDIVHCNSFLFNMHGIRCSVSVSTWWWWPPARGSVSLQQSQFHQHIEWNRYWVSKWLATFVATLSKVRALRFFLLFSFGLFSFVCIYLPSLYTCHYIRLLLAGFCLYDHFRRKIVFWFNEVSLSMQWFTSYLCQCRLKLWSQPLVSGCCLGKL